MGEEGHDVGVNTSGTLHPWTKGEPDGTASRTGVAGRLSFLFASRISRAKAGEVTFSYRRLGTLPYLTLPYLT